MREHLGCLFQMSVSLSPKSSHWLPGSHIEGGDDTGPYGTIPASDVAFCPQNKSVLFHTFLSGASVLSG